MNSDFREFIDALNDHDVRYLIVGAYAVALHGHPRYTKDLDIWIDRSRENAEKLLQALGDFGFGELALSVDDFMEPETVIQLGYPPNRIDLIVDLSGVDFDTCYAARVGVDIDGIQASFIDLSHLKENKRATGRHQDLADLENLE